MRRIFGLVSAAAVTTVLVCAPAASATTAFTWTGAATSPDWSQPSNWVGGVPTAPIGQLVFGDLGGTCDASTSACYSTVDDLGAQTVDNMNIDSNSGYVIAQDSQDDSQLELDPTSGYGIDATTSQSAAGGAAQIDVPIFLDDSQVWAIDGGGHAGAGVETQIVTSSNSLQADLTHDGTLYLNHLNLDGPLLATGDGSGVVALAGNQAVIIWIDPIHLDNGTGFLDLSPDASTVPIALDSNPGPTGFLFAIGGGSAPDGTLAVSGQQDFGPTSHLRFDIDDNGTTPSTDYSQMTTTGGVNFGGATISVNQGTTASGTCATLAPNSINLIDSPDQPLTGNLTYVDTQGNTDTLTEGETSAPIRLGACPGSTSPPAQITLTYSAYGLMATVLAAPQMLFAPLISGSSLVGQTLTITRSGFFTGYPTPQLSYQWMLCSPSCTPIAGATGPTLTLTSADVGSEVVLRVTATNILGSVGGYSYAIGPVSTTSTPPMTTPPTVGQVTAALNSMGHPSGRKAIAALLKSKSFTVTFHAPSAGALSIVWTATVTTGAGKHKKHKTVTIATGSAHPGGAGLIHVAVHLTGSGKSLLGKKQSGISVTSTEKFRPNGGRSTQITKRFGL